ncbi:MAG: hypothetical protein CMM52_13940 [Rhodospirillaceae bacterium]|nr:hypothetical protein [Rhodospirillaceae bacterium]|tara:strand:+ start:4565 stop:5035 length:471 start_codon:yes stop_codon:yes gene_type:complete
MVANKFSIGRTTGIAAAVAVSLTAFSGSALAQKEIKLTAIDGYPAKALWVKTFVKYFVPAVDKALAKTGNYKIKWNLAWGGQTVKPKGVFKGLQKGLGDLGIVTTVFHADKAPLHGLSFATPLSQQTQDCWRELSTTWSPRIQISRKHGRNTTRSI